MCARSFYERMERQKEVFAKNKYGSAVAVLGNEGRRCAQLLRELSLEFLRGDFNGARKVIDKSFVAQENLLNLYREDIMDIIFGMAKDEMSYKDFIGIAYDSVLHENYILFYAMINLIVYKLNTAQRMFFDDTYCLKDTLAKIEDKINLRRTFGREKTKLSYFYEECIEQYYPAGNVFTSKDDYVYKQESIYGDYDDLNLDFVKNDFSNGVNNERMRKFIVEVDNYLNTIGNATKSGEMWNYLVEALMCDYLESPFMWNEDMSKSLLKAIVGYSQCYRNESITKYSEIMRNFILSKLDRLRTVISLFPRSSKNPAQNDVNMLEIAKFLINLYYAFPFNEVLRFASIEVVGDLEWIISSDDYEKEKNLKEIKEVINQLENEEIKNKIGGAGFGLGVPSVSEIVGCGVLQQSEKPQFTTIYLGVNFAPCATEKIELTFFDENEQEIILGRYPEERMRVELGEDVANGGYSIYEIPILNCSNVVSVKARIIEKGIQREDHRHCGTQREKACLNEDNTETIPKYIMPIEEKEKTNKNCIAGFMLGILSAFFYWIVPVILPLAAAIVSGVGLTEVAETEEAGKGMGIWGLVLGIIFTIQSIIKLTVIGSL